MESPLYNEWMEEERKESAIATTQKYIEIQLILHAIITKSLYLFIGIL